MGLDRSLHRRSKRLGQNFLKDPRIAFRIVSLAEIHRTDLVLEPGAGYGTLTRQLANKAGRVIAVEKDRYLASYLRQAFRDSPSVQIVEGDVLKAELPLFNKIVGTPPYYLSSKLILFSIESKPQATYLVLQKEFGERLAAQPGTRDYGRLSVVAQRSLNISPLMHIPRTAFRPAPKVDSTLLAMTPRTNMKKVDNETFSELVRGLFNQRRRLLKSALLHFLRLKLGVSESRRAMEGLRISEARVFQLSAEDLEELSQQLQNVLRSGVETT